MRVTVRLFARLRDLVGAGELVRDVAGRRDGRAACGTSLVADYPAIAPYAESMSCAVNADYARMTTAVSDGDEVAFLPPVSGDATIPGWPLRLAGDGSMLQASAVRPRHVPSPSTCSVHR